MDDRFDLAQRHGLPFELGFGLSSPMLLDRTHAAVSWIASTTAACRDQCTLHWAGAADHHRVGQAHQVITGTLSAVQRPS